MVTEASLFLSLSFPLYEVRFKCGKGVGGHNNLHDEVHSFNKVLMNTRCLMSLILCYSWTTFTLFIRKEVCASIVQHAMHSETALLGITGFDHRVHAEFLVAYSEELKICPWHFSSVNFSFSDHTNVPVHLIYNMTL